LDSPSIFVGADKLNSLTVCQEDTTHDASAQGDASHDDVVCFWMCIGYIMSSSYGSRTGRKFCVSGELGVSIYDSILYRMMHVL